MGLNISVSSNIRDVIQRLDQRRVKSQIATAVALTQTAKQVEAAERSEFAKDLDRPKPFTLNALRTLPATPASLTAEVLLKTYISNPSAQHYLEPQVHGGSRPLKAFEKRLFKYLPQGWFVVPGKGAKLDAYGNMTRQQIVDVLTALQALPPPSAQSRRGRRKVGDYVVSTPGNPFKTSKGGRLPYGVWLRKGRGIVNILFFVPRVSYRRRLPFFDVAQAVSTKQFPENLARARAGA